MKIDLKTLQDAMYECHDIAADPKVRYHGELYMRAYDAEEAISRLISWLSDPVINGGDIYG